MAILGKAPPTPAKANTARLLAKLAAVGKPLAVGALALAAEAAVTWLGRQAGRETPGSLPTIRPAADPASRVGTLEFEDSCEEVLLVFAQDGARSGWLFMRRSALIGRYAGGR